MACIRLKPKQGLLEHAEPSLLHTYRPRNGEPALLRDRPLSPGELLKEDPEREWAPEASLALHIIENANVVHLTRSVCHVTLGRDTGCASGVEHGPCVLSFSGWAGSSLPRTRGVVLVCHGGGPRSPRCG